MISKYISEKKLGPMGHDTREITRKAANMERVHSSGQMVHNTMETFKMICNTAQESTFMQMDVSITVNGLMIRKMAKDDLDGQMEDSILDNTKTV